MKRRIYCFILALMIIISAGFPCNNVDAASTKTYKNKIVKINNNLYYYNASGKMVKKKIITYKGKKYYAQKKGTLAKSKFLTYKNKRYYASKNGTIKQNTFFRVNGKLYYAGKAGVIYKNKLLTVNKKKYYMQKDYSVATNKKVTVNGKTYSANKNGVLTLISDNKKPDKTTTESTTEKNTTQSTTEAPGNKECSHEWVVDVAAHYEWQFVYDENGNEIQHQFCKTCGCDINNLYEELKKRYPEIKDITWGDALQWHLDNSTYKCCGSANSMYVHTIDENGNEVDHPLKGRTYSKYTYMPDTYKCSKCGARLHLPSSYEKDWIYDIYLLQKNGEGTDLSSLRWISANAGKLDKGGTTIVNGKTLTCVAW